MFPWLRELGARPSHSSHPFGTLDNMTPIARSRLMSRVRRKGTGIEVALRKALWATGLRYRLSTKERLPGSPDIIFPGAMVVVFVDGCFWHGCPVHGTMPKSRPDFWATKITRNRERDRQVDTNLVQLGWKVLRFWEHDIRARLQDCVAEVATALVRNE